MARTTSPPNSAAVRGAGSRGRAWSGIEQWKGVRIVETAKQEWERVFGDRAIEVLENNNSDLSFALAACMEWLGIEYGVVGQYHVYLCEDGGAAAIRIDADGTGKRIPSRIEEIRHAE